MCNFGKIPFGNVTKAKSNLVQKSKWVTVLEHPNRSCEPMKHGVLSDQFYLENQTANKPNLVQKYK